MKKLLLIGAYSFLTFIISNTSFADLPPAKMSSTTTPSKTMEGTSKPLGPLKPETPPAPIKQELPAPVKPPSLLPQKAEYLHPGILVFFNGRWEGSDHLLNLTNNIGVSVSIIKPENEILEVNEASIRKVVEDIFSQGGIRPQTLVTSGNPPLPAFEIEIFVYPIERGYVASCEGRLFESVILERFKLDPNMAFQAITWESQHLIVSPKAQFVEQLNKTVQDIAVAFTDRFQTYERLRKG